jgi:hypothetical protein
MAVGAGLAGVLTLMLPIPMILRAASILVLPGLLGILMISESNTRKSR